MKNKYYRKSLDIGMTFLSSERKNYLQDIYNPPPIIKKPFIGSDNNSSPIGNPQNTHSKIKIIIKPILRKIFNRIKPIILPPIFRLRKYLIEGIRQEIAYDLQQKIDITHEQLKGCIESLSREITKNNQSLTANEANSNEIKLLLNKLTKELSASQENNLNEIYKIKREAEVALKKTTQENQRLTISTAEELQKQHAYVSSKLDRIESYSYTTARRVTINCDSGEVLVRTEVGFVLCAANDYALLTCLIESGELELGTRLLIQEYLAPGDTYIDIGANIGMHTLAAARAMQGKGKIIAFEPYGPTKAMLEKSVWINGFSDMVEIHQAAVSNVTGQQALYLGETSGHHSLFELEGSQESSKPAVEVSLLRLDETIQATSKVDLLKIDVEGAELEVLESAKTLIENNKDIALIVEFGPSHLKRTGHTPERWLAEFEQLGLVYQAIHPTTGVLESWTIEQLRTVDSINLFWSRPDSNAWGRLTK